MVKRKAEVEQDASRAPARRSSRNKPSENNVKSEEPETDSVRPSKIKVSETKAKKPSKKVDVKAEVKVGPAFSFSFPKHSWTSFGLDLNNDLLAMTIAIVCSSQL